MTHSAQGRQATIDTFGSSRTHRVADGRRFIRTSEDERVRRRAGAVRRGRDDGGRGFEAIQGVVALINDTFYVAGEKWLFSFDITTWGWIHLMMGIALAVAGAFVLRGAGWARTVGVAVAVLSAVLTFAWLPYYPVWSMLIIALDVFVIWALIAQGRELAR